MRRILRIVLLAAAVITVPAAGARAADTVAVSYRDAFYNPAGESRGQLYGALTYTLGGGATRVLDAEGANDHIGWSPNGQRLAYGLQHDLLVADADGSNRTLIRGAAGYTPSWSPDGSRIAYVGFAPGSPEPEPPAFRVLGDVYTVAADGSDARVVNAGHSVQSVSWSRNDLIATTDYGGDDHGIHVMRPDGSGDRLLAPGFYDKVQWSPDGRRLLALQGIARPKITTLDPATDRIKTLRIRATATSWTPDGRIAYLSQAPLGENVLNVVRADGRGRHRTYQLPQPELDARDYLDVSFRPR